MSSVVTPRILMIINAAFVLLTLKWISYELWFAISILFSTVTCALLSTWTCKVLLSSYEFLISCAQGCSQSQQVFIEWYDKCLTKIVFSVHTVSYGSSFFLTGAINQRGKTWSVTYMCKSTWGRKSKGKNLVCHLQLYGPPFSSPEGALLLVSTKNHDLWEAPTPEVHNSQTSVTLCRHKSSLKQILYTRLEN